MFAEEVEHVPRPRAMAASFLKSAGWTTSRTLLHCWVLSQLPMPTGQLCAAETVAGRSVLSAAVLRCNELLETDQPVSNTIEYVDCYSFFYATGSGNVERRYSEKTKRTRRRSSAARTLNQSNMASSMHIRLGMCRPSCSYQAAASPLAARPWCGARSRRLAASASNQTPLGAGGQQTAMQQHPLPPVLLYNPHWLMHQQKM